MDKTQPVIHIIYECGCCSHYHPWNWNGDCREDANRFADEYDYAERKGIPHNLVLNLVEVRNLEEEENEDS